MTQVLEEAPSGLLNRDPGPDDGTDTRADVAVTKQAAEPKPRSRSSTQSQFWPGHARARTQEEREAAFECYLEQSEPHFAAIRQRGGTPWHDEDTAVRRELFYRRYNRPQPPSGLEPIKSLSDVVNENYWRAADPGRPNTTK